MVWVWSVSLPVTILNSPKVSYGPEGGGSGDFNAATDIVGVVLFAVGFTIETVADIQKVITQELHGPNLIPFIDFIFVYSCIIGLAVVDPWRVAKGSINSEARIKIQSCSWTRDSGHGVVIQITLEKSPSGSASG